MFPVNLFSVSSKISKHVAFFHTIGMDPSKLLSLRYTFRISVIFSCEYGKIPKKLLDDKSKKCKIGSTNNLEPFQIAYCLKDPKFSNFFKFFHLQIESGKEPLMRLSLRNNISNFGI